MWLRAARNYLRGGSVCDRVSAGECRDTFTLAPVGTTMRYGRSLHTAAIVAVHRVATWVDPHYPLPASAYLVPVIVGVLGGRAFRHVLDSLDSAGVLDTAISSGMVT